MSVQSNDQLRTATVDALVEVLTPAEASKFLKVSQGKLRTMVREGRVPCLRMGEKKGCAVRYMLSDLREYLVRERARTRNVLHQERSEGGCEPWRA